MKRLIINADDLGLTESVNRAIVRGYREGVLTSATLMANGAAYDDAVCIAREHPGLGVGLHLNILRGRPVLPPERIRSLVGPNGLFVAFVINLFPVILLFAITAALSTWLHQLTGTVYAGAILNSLIITWVFASSQVIAPIPV